MFFLLSFSRLSVYELLPLTSVAIFLATSSKLWTNPIGSLKLVTARTLCGTLFFACANLVLITVHYLRPASMSSPYPAETNGGVVTSWIPLTTSFASVSGCSNSYMLEGPSLVAFDPGYGLSINSDATCQPSAVTTWWKQARLGGGSGSGHTAVSILPLTCPDGWSTVATSISDSTTTQAMCCPP
jgi:hypothetical protein